MTIDERIMFLVLSSKALHISCQESNASMAGDTKQLAEDTDLNRLLAQIENRRRPNLEDSAS